MKAFSGPFTNDIGGAPGAVTGPAFYVPGEPELQGEAPLRDGRTRVLAYAQASIEGRAGTRDAVRRVVVSPSVILLGSTGGSPGGPRCRVSADDALAEPGTALHRLYRDTIPGTGQPEEALELVRHAARRASVFSLAAFIALGRFDREQLEDAERIAGVLEVLRQ